MILKASLTEELRFKGHSSVSQKLSIKGDAGWTFKLRQNCISRDVFNRLKAFSCGRENKELF